MSHWQDSYNVNDLIDAKPGNDWLPGTVASKVADIGIFCRLDAGTFIAGNPDVIRRRVQAAAKAGPAPKPTVAKADPSAKPAPAAKDNKGPPA